MHSTPRAAKTVWSVFLFSVPSFISNISDAYKQSKWYTRGEIQKHLKKKKTLEKGEKETSKCKIRNMFKKLMSKSKISRGV